MCFLLLTSLTIDSNSKLLGHILMKGGLIRSFSLNPTRLGTVAFKLASLDLLLRKFNYSPTINQQMLKEGSI